MTKLTANTVDQWLADSEVFSLAFMQYSFTWHHPVGVDITLHREEIQKAHAAWVSKVQEWQASYFRQETFSLSYTKIFGALLWALSEHVFCGDIREYEGLQHPKPEFQGTDEERQEWVDDLCGAPEVVTAMQFCISVLQFYESKRIDRTSPYVFRMTESGRHDLIMALHEKRIDALATYLTLDAWFARN